MTVHLLKMAVRIDSIDHLARRQRERMAEAGRGFDEVYHLTRNMPRRAAEVLDGGSIYWVIRRVIRVRQRILRFDRAVNSRGDPRCAIILDPELVPTGARPQRPFQGWRYFDREEAPEDREASDIAGDDLPPEMAEELRALGLL